MHRAGPRAHVKLFPVISTAPLALYDSGLGGLSVVRQVLARLPGESVVYFGDTARVPYGPRPAAEILAFNREILAILLAGGAKLAVIACNTSSAIALEALRPGCPVPLLGLIDAGAEAALTAARGGAIGVIATEATVRSGAYGRAVRDAAPNARVQEVACPGLVPLVERGAWSGPEAIATVAAALAPFQADPPAALILGCTHYPHLAPVIRALLPGVALVDPAEGVVVRVAAILAAQGLAAPMGHRPSHRFLVSGDPEPFFHAARALLPGAVDGVQQVHLDLQPA